MNTKPNSYGEYLLMKEEIPQYIRYTKCNCCKSDFTKDNVKTSFGWRETQISGYCELCFDQLFPEDDDEC